LEAQGKPALTINMVFATIATIMGEMVNSRADVTFRPFIDGAEETAKALSQIYMQISNANGLDWLEAEVAEDGFITSRGFFDVRMDFEDQIRGEVKLGLLNPKNVIVDPDAESYDPKGWKEVFLTKWRTPDDIGRIYNNAAAGKRLAAKKNSDFMYGYDSIDDIFQGFRGENRRNTFGQIYDTSRDKNTRRFIRTVERQFKEVLRKEHFINYETGDLRIIPENWERERISYVMQEYGLGVIEKKVERIHWLVTADDEVLFDKVSPYKYFTPVPYFPFFRRGKTIGLVENLLSPQDQLNKVSSQELHVVNTTANSGWRVKTGSLSNMEVEDLEQRGAETGLVLELDNVDDAQKIQPNQIPTGLDRIGFKSEEWIKGISGVSDSQRGFDRADVAAKAIQQKRAAGSVNLGKPFDNLGRSRAMLAERVLDLVQTYYVEERVYQITGRGLQDPTTELTINQTQPDGNVVNDLTIGEYQVVVTPVPNRDSMQDSQFEEAMRLREAGIALPDDVIVEHSHLNRKAEIVERLKQLNGGGDPSEQQLQLADLEVQKAELDNLAQDAEAKRKLAEAALAEARANKVTVETQAEADALQSGGITAKEQAEIDKMEIELRIMKEKVEAELELRREQVEAEIEIRREQMRADSLLRRAESAERLEIDKANAEAKRQKEAEKQTEVKANAAQ